MAYMAEAGGGLAASCSSGDAMLAAREAEMTRLVPALLDAMNAASTEVNGLDREVSQAQERCQWLLAQCDQLREEMSGGRKGYSGKASPFLQAAESVRSTLECVRAATCSYTAANIKHDLAKAHLAAAEAQFSSGGFSEPGVLDLLADATEQVMRAEQERDRSDAEHARAIKDFEHARESIAQLADAEPARLWLGGLGGLGAIRRATIKKLKLCQLELAQEQNRVDSLTVRARIAKGTYRNSIRELDRISTSVHAVRHNHRKASASEEERGSPVSTMSCEVFGDDMPEEPCRRTPSARNAAAAVRRDPEVSPEPEEDTTVGSCPFD